MDNSSLMRSRNRTANLPEANDFQEFVGHLTSLTY